MVTRSSNDVLVVGGGVIGLSIAWRCAQRGLAVTLIDPDPGTGASFTAAGMLAPVTELHYEGRDLLALNLESAARYPSFATELHDVTGLDIGFRRCGTVAAAWDAADLTEMRQLHAFQVSLGVTSELLTSRALRDAEPALAAGLPGGLLATDDHQVDNRLLHAALLSAVRGAGAQLIAARVTRANTTGDRVTGVETDAGDHLDAPVTVLAAGAWSRAIAGLPAVALPPVRPVKGQTLRLRGPVGLLSHVVRGTVKGHPVYVVPRADGGLVVGASSEEAGFNTSPRAGAVYDLLRDAQTLVPQLSEVEFVEVSTSLRPGSPDNAPMIGRGALAGLIVATGHYRNGILLTPVTGDEVARLIADDRVPDLLRPFDPQRFTRPRDDRQPDMQQHDRSQSDPSQSDPSQSDRSQGDPSQGVRSEGDRQQGDRQQGDRQQGDRQQGDPKQAARQQGTEVPA
jgi:glycine oxidase